MIKRWTIANVPEETINVIKQRAIDYGVSIANVLVTEFGGEEVLEKKDNWTIWNMPQEVREDIIALARKSKQSVPDTLKALLESNNHEKMEKEMKERLDKAVKLCLKEFRYS